MKKKFLDVGFEVKSHHVQKGEDGEPSIGIVKGYASTFNNIDRVGDIMHPNSFDKTIADHKARNMRGIRILYNHDRDMLLGHAPIESVKVDEHGLYIEAHLNLEVEKAREVYAFVKQGVLRDFSIGYYEREYSYNTETGINTVLEAELLETSIVNEPANQSAQITDVKHIQDSVLLPLAERDYVWNSEEAMKRLEESDNVTKSALFLDGEELKFHVADVVEGELKAVPSAIFDVAAQLKGLKECPELSDVDTKALQRLVSKYYREMGLTIDFTAKSVDKVDVEQMKSLEEVESLLGVLGCSNNAAKALISKVRSLASPSDRDDLGEKGDRDDQLEKAVSLVDSLTETLKSLNNQPK